jgi:hypothetical protein
MKLITMFFLFLPMYVMADWCDIQDRKTKQVLNTYEGQCDQRKFGGPWGEKESTVHVPNTRKQKEIEDRAALEAAKQSERNARILRLRETCPKAEGMQKDICDQILNN